MRTGSLKTQSSPWAQISAQSDARKRLLRAIRGERRLQGLRLEALAFRVVYEDLNVLPER
jgi:hypothetical protein